MIIIAEMKAHKKPAKDTVVNFGVSLLHLKDTEKIANPSDENKPKNNPEMEPVFWFPNAIIKIPIDATLIEIHTLKEIFDRTPEEL